MAGLRAGGLEGGGEGEGVAEGALDGHVLCGVLGLVVDVGVAVLGFAVF